MLIRIHGIIIMIYMIFWGYHIRNNQTKKFGYGTFAVCKNHGTRQRCQSLPYAKTMAHGKDLNFAVCHVCRAHGKYLATSSFLAVYFYFVVGREWHTANPLLCARYIAHGKGRLCRCLVAVCALPCAAHGKGFAVGFWGFAKVVSPVVMYDEGRMHDEGR